MTEQTIQVAKCCGSCHWANFGYSGWGGKKKIVGLCFLNTTGDSPDTLEIPGDPCRNTVMYTRAKVMGELMPLDEWMKTQAYLDDLDEKVKYPYWAEIEGLTRREYLTYTWNEFKANFDWWEANRPNLRDIHRENVCEHWQPVNRPKVRLLAKAKANKNGRIDWDKKGGR